MDIWAWKLIRLHLSIEKKQWFILVEQGLRCRCMVAYYYGCPPPFITLPRVTYYRSGCCCQISLYGQTMLSCFYDILSPIS